MAISRIVNIMLYSRFSLPLAGDHLTYLDYPHFHFAGRFRADPATLNNFPAYYDTGNITTSDTQPTVDNWNPLGSGEWSVEACITLVCYSDFRCVGDPVEDPICGVRIKGNLIFFR